MNSLSEKQAMFAMGISKLIQKSAELGTPIKIVELYRTLEQQKEKVANGLSKTLESKHLDGLAVDVMIVQNGKIREEKELYRPLGIFWESIGGRWGGRFGVDVKDYDSKIGWDEKHFEIT